MASRRPSVLITGINGQDGAYLAQALISDGCKVYGTIRNAQSDLWRLRELGIEHQVSIASLDFSTGAEIGHVLREAKPDWVVNLAAVSSLGESEANSELTRTVNFETPKRLFSSFLDNHPHGRVFQASSALVFGLPQKAPQTELTERRPDTHYGRAKNAMDQEISLLRDRGFFAVSGIFYNHESPLRGANFVSTKIVEGLVALKMGGASPLELGSLGDIRDWSYARDFAAGIMLTLKADKPEDWIFASGKAHVVYDWILIAGRLLGYSPVIVETQSGVSVDCKRTGKRLAVAKSQEHSMVMAANRVGNPEKLITKSGWKPDFTFESLVEDMVSQALKRLSE